MCVHVCLCNPHFFINWYDVFRSQHDLSFADNQAYLQQESQGTIASKDKCFVHPLAASVKDNDRATYKKSSILHGLY